MNTPIPKQKTVKYIYIKNFTLKLHDLIHENQHASLSDAVIKQCKQDGQTFTTVAVPNCRCTRQNDASAAMNHRPPQIHEQTRDRTCTFHAHFVQIKIITTPCPHSFSLWPSPTTTTCIFCYTTLVMQLTWFNSHHFALDQLPSSDLHEILPNALPHDLF